MEAATEAVNSSWRILAVDDMPQILHLVEGILCEAGYSVATADSGERALVAFQEWRPDLILLDLMMPGLDGFQTCRQIRGLPGGREVAIVFLTGFGDSAIQERSIESEADDFLTKPIARVELLVRVRSLLRERQLRRDLVRGYDVIRAQRDALLDAQRQKDELSALVVHDLRSPLAAVLANLEYVQKTAALGADQRDALRDARESADSIQRLVANLLDISRSESGTLTPKIGDVNLPEVITKLCEAMKRRADDAHVELTQDLKALTGRGDSKLVERIVENLVDNGLRYSKAGGKVNVAVRPGGDRFVEIRVSDEGPGVPEAWRERIFEKFVRLEDAGSAQRVGRGLGLAFCRLVAEAHGGSIWVEPNHPKGSVFCVRLPATADNAAFTGDLPALAADSEKP